MLAEVITDRFKKSNGEGPYALPVAARLGLAIIDNAHEALLGRLNAVHRCLSAGDEVNARLLLEELKSDLATHFDIEEQIMQAMGFGGVRDHVRCHAANAARVEQIYRASLARGSLQINDLNLCFQALIDEILHSDIDLKSHLQEMGTSRYAQS